MIIRLIDFIESLKLDESDIYLELYNNNDKIWAGNILWCPDEYKDYIIDKMETGNNCIRIDVLED